MIRFTFCFWDSCLDFGDDLELSGTEVSDKELSKLPADGN